MACLIFGSRSFSANAGKVTTFTRRKRPELASATLGSSFMAQQTLDCALPHTSPSRKEKLDRAGTQNTPRASRGPHTPVGTRLATYPTARPVGYQDRHPTGPTGRHR